MPLINQQKTKYVRLDQPHIQPIGATFSITIVAHDAVPEQVLDRVKQRKRVVLEAIAKDELPNKDQRKQNIHDLYYEYYEKLLHQHRAQEHPFRNPSAALALKERIESYNGHYYDLVAYTIMSNHAHLQLDLSLQCPRGWNGTDVIPDYVNLATITGRIKGGSAHDVNKATGRSGKLWRPGYYDRYMRNQRHLMAEFWYILRNAEKAGIVGNWREHHFTYGDPNLTGPFPGL